MGRKGIGENHQKNCSIQHLMAPVFLIARRNNYYIMKRFFLGLIVGMVVTVICFLNIKRIIERPHQSSSQWNCGDFIVCTTLSNCANRGIGLTLKDRPYPKVLFQPRSFTNNENEIMGYVAIVDSKNHEVQIDYNERDRVFTNLIYSTGLASNHVSYRDSHLDGEFEDRIGPGKIKAHFIGGKWYSYILDKSDVYVNDGDHLKKVIIKNGKWAIDSKDIQ